jgi:hypothetical protein
LNASSSASLLSFAMVVGPPCAYVWLAASGRPLSSSVHVMPRALDNQDQARAGR